MQFKRLQVENGLCLLASESLAAFFLELCFTQHYREWTGRKKHELDSDWQDTFHKDYEYSSTCGRIL